MKTPQLLERTNPSTYINGNPLFLDFETTSIEKGTALNSKNNVVLACWDFQGEQKHLFGKEFNMQPLLEDIAKADFIVAHNAKFEMQWLRRMGLDLRSVLCYDTFLGEWVLAGNRSWGLGLDDCLARRGIGSKEAFVSRLIKMGVCPSQINKQWLLEYCATDVARTKELFFLQLAEVVNLKLTHLVYSRCLMAACLADMEFSGLTLDKEAVENEYDKVLSEHKQLSERLAEISGGINLRSTVQVAELLYDKLGFKELTRRGQPLRTASGRRLTDAGSLAQLKASNKEQREFLDTYKKLAKCNAKLTKTLHFFREVCNNHDCTFYGIFNQGITDTHRLSSSGRPILLRDAETGKEKARGIQLQNIPREYKRLIRAKQPGWLTAEADGSQLEFRVAADMGNDKIATEEIRNSVDIHTITADVFLKSGTQPEFKGLTLKEARQPAKPQTFKPLILAASI